MKNQKKKKSEFVITNGECFKCGGLIDVKKDNYISLDTYKEGTLIERAEFHARCWGDYNVQRFNERLAESASLGMNIFKQMGIRM